MLAKFESKLSASNCAGIALNVGHKRATVSNIESWFGSKLVNRQFVQILLLVLAAFNWLRKGWKQVGS